MKLDLFFDRRELEKLVKEIRAIDPDKKCQFKYDKLLIDDDVFVYNDVERRIERLPYTVAGHHHLASGLADSTDAAGGGLAAGGGFGGSVGNLAAALQGGGNNPSSLPALLQEDTPSATLGRHRYALFHEPYFKKQIAVQFLPKF